MKAFKYLAALMALCASGNGYEVPSFYIDPLNQCDYYYNYRMYGIGERTQGYLFMHRGFLAESDENLMMADSNPVAYVYRPDLGLQFAFEDVPIQIDSEINVPGDETPQEDDPAALREDGAESTSSTGNEDVPNYDNDADQDGILDYEFRYSCTEVDTKRVLENDFLSLTGEAIRSLMFTEPVGVFNTIDLEHDPCGFRKMNNQNFMDVAVYKNEMYTLFFKKEGDNPIKFSDLIMVGQDPEGLDGVVLPNCNPTEDSTDVFSDDMNGVAYVMPLGSVGFSRTYIMDEVKLGNAAANTEELKSRITNAWTEHISHVKEAENGCTNWNSEIDVTKVDDTICTEQYENPLINYEKEVAAQSSAMAPVATIFAVAAAIAAVFAF